MTRQGIRASAIAGALALVLGLSLAGCGEKDGTDSAKESPSSPTTSEPTEPTPTTEPTGPQGPPCEKVWVAGSVLPKNYNGCQDDEKDKFVQAMVYHCSSGQRLVTFRRNFYAAKGEVINETTTPLARDADFQKVLATCGA